LRAALSFTLVIEGYNFKNPRNANSLLEKGTFVVASHT
jgi:hypothetical protein